MHKSIRLESTGGWKWTMELLGRFSFVLIGATVITVLAEWLLIYFGNIESIRKVFLWSFSSYKLDIYCFVMLHILGILFNKNNKHVEALLVRVMALRIIYVETLGWFGLGFSDLKLFMICIIFGIYSCISIKYTINRMIFRSSLDRIIDQDRLNIKEQGNSIGMGFIRNVWVTKAPSQPAWRKFLGMLQGLNFPINMLGLIIAASAALAFCLPNHALAASMEIFSSLFLCTYK